jgi:rubrerythrin
MGMNKVSLRSPITSIVPPDQELIMAEFAVMEQSSSQPGGERLVHFLRTSIEQTATPICEKCHEEMAWSRSALIEDEQAIVHVFVCARCGTIVETKTPIPAKE